MTKCKSFDKKTTSSIGIWWDNHANNFKSNVINLSVFKSFKGNARIIMMKNKFYEKGSDKPNYIAYITDAKSVDAKNIDVVYFCNDDEIQVFTRDQVKDIIRGTARDVRYGIDESDILPEDFAEQCYVNERFLK